MNHPMRPDVHLGALALLLGGTGAAALIGVMASVQAVGRVRRLAAGLLLPYLVWVTFAAALTYAVWRRNPELL